MGVVGIPSTGNEAERQPELGALDIRAPCSGDPAASVIATPGIVAVSISPAMGASLHAHPELEICARTRSHVGGVHALGPRVLACIEVLSSYGGCILATHHRHSLI